MSYNKFYTNDFFINETILYKQFFHKRYLFRGFNLKFEKWKLFEVDSCDFQDLLLRYWDVKCNVVYMNIYRVMR